MESGDGKKANETRDSFRRDALGPFVHRSAAVSEEIDGDVKESGLAGRAANLFGDLGGDDPRDVRPRNLDPRNPIVGAHSHDPKAQCPDRSLCRLDTLQLFHGDYLAVCDSGGQTGVARLVEETEVQLPSQASHLRLLEAEFDQRMPETGF